MAAHIYIIYNEKYNKRNMNKAKYKIKINPEKMTRLQQKTPTHNA